MADNGIELAQHAQDVVGGLHAGRGPAGDAHRAAGDHGGRQERTAFVRSGSTSQCRAATAPGRTCQRLPTESSTSTPACRSIAIVIAMCGAEGSIEPVC